MGQQNFIDASQLNWALVHITWMFPYYDGRHTYKLEHISTKIPIYE